MVATAKQEIRQSVERQRGELIALSRRIHGHPELSFQEEAASGWLADYLMACGFEVERGAHGLPTALVARAGRGSLRVALCAEYDALPGIGHACGHNLIAAAAAGAGAGLVAVADDLDLTVLVIGSPGEELYSLASVPDDVRGPGKALLLERGAFDGVHLALMAHPAPVDVATPPPRAAGRLHASFRLRDGTGTRFADPAELRRLDEAMAVAQVAITALATHLSPAARISTVGTSGCWSTTSSDAEIGFGAASLSDLEDLEQALDRCFQAGALGTGTEVELTTHLPYAELRPDPELVAAYRTNAEALGRAFPDLGPLLDRLNYATDMGNVSHRVPAIHPFFGIGASVVNHDPAFAEFAAGDLAQESMLQAAVALAWTAVDAATRPELRSHLLQPPHS